MENTKILEKDLSYKLQGIFINISKKYGCNFKEEIYHNACRFEFIKQKIDFISKPKIKIFTDYGDVLGLYIPDFIINNKILIEIKAQKCLFESSIDQLVKYLQRSDYEIGYLVNFGTSYAQIIRRVYSNERKL